MEEGDLFGIAQARAWKEKFFPSPRLPKEEYNQKPFIFDIETHIWNGRHRIRVPWIDDFLKGVELRVAWYRMEPKVDLTHITLERYVQEIYVESECDMAFTCSLQAFGVRKLEAERYIAEPEDVAIAQKAYPNRNIAAGLIAPVIAGDEGVESIEYQVKKLGIRVWSETYNFVQRPSAPREQRVTYWRYDDKRVYPVLEKLVELNAPILCLSGPRPADGRCDWADIHIVARSFPELTFIIYHFGGIHYKSAAHAAAANKNVYIGWNVKHDPLRSVPERYLERFAEIYAITGPDKMVWGTDWPATGYMQFQIEACKALQFPKEIRARYALPELTEDDKRKMLGINMVGVLKKHGFIESLEDQRKKIRDDEFSQKAAKVLPGIKAKFKRILLESHSFWKKPEHWMIWEYEREETLKVLGFKPSQV